MTRPSNAQAAAAVALFVNTALMVNMHIHGGKLSLVQLSVQSFCHLAHIRVLIAD
jgi:hypothetical protein